jgi:hypothetical protein
MASLTLGKLPELIPSDGSEAAKPNSLVISSIQQNEQTSLGQQRAKVDAVSSSAS